ncbi:MAG TPA: glycoside hydrolase family 15 protein [Acidisphaera sp.]|nr:glycoside hydrolase family 15 protein [Acidisphaera sp.]HME20372.1 glycoside hydrolase family 15 protein [Acetobacteraceae bacterium]
MTTMQHVRAMVGSGDTDPVTPSVSFAQADLETIAQHMFALMLRNITSDGFVLNDPNSREPSKPGCVIAAPSYPRNTPGVDQDYVFNWVRDAAITAMEVAAAKAPAGSVGDVQTLIDYVNFAQLCQQNARPTLAHACFTVGGNPRDWTEQTDGPALQTVAILSAYDQVDAPTKAVASAVIGKNLAFLLANYQNPTFNLWEEHEGLSFFARSAQLRCFRAIAANTFGIPVPPGVNDAIAWLQNALDDHWNGSYYVTMLAPPSPGNANKPLLPASAGYDPNIDIVCASLYGAVPCTDTRLLATAARLRSQWADSGSPSLYPINTADHARGLGPMFGRYPGDVYDGDMNAPVLGGHPWALCTCNVAELYYRLANSVDQSKRVPFDDLSRGFFAQVGVNDGSNPAAAAAALRDAGDAMLRAVIFHSDHLELSEQFDGTSGYEKSVTNLTWSYASFLSAVRARTGQNVEG